MEKKKPKPLFSIITVCYNEEKNIEQTCKSIAEQNFNNFEWIIIDGKSADNTLKIIKEYKNYITNLTSEKDFGIYNAMNKGIKKSHGDYILFLNGGDYLKNKNTLKKASQFIKNDNFESDIYYGDLLYDNGELVTYKKSKLDKKFFIKKTISHQATFIKRDLFRKYGNYNETYKIVSDYEFWIRTIINNKVKTKHIPIIISIFDQSGASTNYKSMKQHIKERNNVLLKYNLINKEEERILRIKWNILMILKITKLYYPIRKIYRIIIKR